MFSDGLPDPSFSFDSHGFNLLAKSIEPLGAVAHILGEFSDTFCVGLRGHPHGNELPSFTNTCLSLNLRQEAVPLLFNHRLETKKAARLDSLATK